MSSNLEKAFDSAYKKFKTVILSNSGGEIVDFKSNKYIDTHENYKHKVLENAKSTLMQQTWSENEIGEGRITKLVKKSIQPNVIHNFQKVQNNLVNWRKVDDFRKRKFSLKEEQLYFNFYKSKIKNEIAFEQFHALGFSYQLIAYLFFIKDGNAFLPISQQKMDKIFESIGINFVTSNNGSWDNYQEYNEIFRSFRKQLAQIYPGVNLLDAHSFLWFCGYDVEEALQETSNTNKGIIGEPTHNSDENIEAEIQDEDVESRFPEGAAQYRLHRKLERDPSIARRAKEKRLKEAGDLACDVCGFSFLGYYGEIGSGFIEAHHTVPVSEIQGERKTSVNEIALVCSNCHRMLHTGPTLLSVSELISMVMNQNPNGYQSST